MLDKRNPLTPARGGGHRTGCVALLVFSFYFPSDGASKHLKNNNILKFSGMMIVI